MGRARVCVLSGACANLPRIAGGGTGNDRSSVKERWCDTLLFIAQDHCMADVLRLNRAVTRLNVKGFVKVTRACTARARTWAGWREDGWVEVGVVPHGAS